MWPTLRPGDVAALGEAPPILSPGDVVVARPTGAEGLMIHRVRRLLPDGQVVLQGDGCAFEDPPLPRANIVAQVRRIRRGNTVMLQHEWDRPVLAPLRAAARLYHRGSLWWWRR